MGRFSKKSKNVYLPNETIISYDYVKRATKIYNLLMHNSLNHFEDFFVCLTDKKDEPVVLTNGLYNFIIAPKIEGD